MGDPHAVSTSAVLAEVGMTARPSAQVRMPKRRESRAKPATPTSASRDAVRGMAGASDLLKIVPLPGSGVAVTTVHDRG
jgi:hypothetical protein